MKDYDRQMKRTTNPENGEQLFVARRKAYIEYYVLKLETNLKKPRSKDWER